MSYEQIRELLNYKNNFLFCIGDHDNYTYTFDTKGDIFMTTARVREEFKKIHCLDLIAHPIYPILSLALERIVYDYYEGDLLIVQDAIREEKNIFNFMIEGIGKVYIDENDRRIFNKNYSIILKTAHSKQGVCIIGEIEREINKYS